MKMKMKLTLKRILTSVLAGVMLLGAIFMTSGCKEKKPQGEICKLTTAYNNGYITRNDLLSIAYYHKDKILNPEIDENFQPIEKGELDEEIKLKIQESIAYICRNVKTEAPDYAIWAELGASSIQADDVVITEYFGCYGDSYAFGFYVIDLYAGEIPEWECSETIAGVNLSYYSTTEVVHVWVDKK